MKCSSAKRSKQHPWRHRLIGLIFLTWLAYGCESQAGEDKAVVNGGAQDTSVTDDVSSAAPPQSQDFSAFMALFRPSESLADWPRDGQESIVADGTIFTGKSLDPNLKRHYAPIGEEFAAFIPMDAVKKLDEYGSPIKAPEKAFRWYAFRQIARPNFTLVGMFAHKQNGTENGEFNAHPFLVVTYTADGSRIDDYVWWRVENDDLQVWTDIAVHGDTMITGHRPLPEQFDSALDETFTKVVVDKQGKFRIVYSHPPKPSEG